MTSERKKQYIFGGIIVIAVTVFIIAAFTLMSRTSLMDIPMDPGGGMGWSYELISGSEPRPATPVLIDNFTVSFPDQTCRAVRAERTISEELDGAQLGVYLYDAVCGVDLLLDDEMIYTSFEGAPRDASGFAVTDGIKPAPQGTVQIYLPEDYIGRKLSVVSYFTSETSEIVPVFPFLCSSDTLFAVTSVENVPPIFRTAICAILAFLTALVYVLDISNGKADRRILLLTLFYAMLTIQQAFTSLAGTYSLLAEKMNMLDFVGELYIAPLLLFSAFRLTSWRKWIPAAATGLWFVYDCVKLIRSRMIYGPFYGKASAPVILILYLLTLGMIIAERKRNNSLRPVKSDYICLAIAALAAVGRIFTASAEWGGNIGMYLMQIAVMPFEGYFYPLVIFISYVCAATVTLTVIIEFVKRTLRTRELINVLEEQNNRVMASYNRMAESEKTTYSIRHEMRHHMLALSGMLNDGETGRAREYAAALTEEYDGMPDVQYSKNAMVNIIAGAYLGRARRQGADVKYSFNVPEVLPVSDTDLCVFLTNMFENAARACEKIDEAQTAYIRTKMYINGNYLFIGCTNSAPKPETESRRSRVHGYGLENMKRIAAKYGGTLKIDRDDSSFSVKSAFFLTNEIPRQ